MFFAFCPKDCLSPKDLIRLAGLFPYQSLVVNILLTDVCIKNFHLETSPQYKVLLQNKDSSCTAIIIFIVFRQEPTGAPLMNVLTYFLQGTIAKQSEHI